MDPQRFKDIARMYYSLGTTSKTAGIKFPKFIKKHKKGLAGLTAAGLAGVAGLAGTNLVRNARMTEAIRRQSARQLWNDQVAAKIKRQALEAERVAEAGRVAGEAARRTMAERVAEGAMADFLGLPNKYSRFTHFNFLSDKEILINTAKFEAWKAKRLMAKQLGPEAADKALDGFTHPLY